MDGEHRCDGECMGAQKQLVQSKQGRPKEQVPRPPKGDWEISGLLTSITAVFEENILTDI